MTVISEQKIKAAESIGLTVVGQPTEKFKDNDKYILYKFNTCGHLQNIDTEGVRKALVKCQQCEHIRLVEAAEKVGLTLLERAHKGTPALYHFNECGHEQRIGYDAVYKNLFKCRQCYYSDATAEERNKVAAEKQGLVYKGQSGPCKGLYFRPACGHVFNYQHSAVKAANKAKYNIGCSVCDAEEFKAVAIKWNVTNLVRQGQHSTYTRSCGHNHRQVYHVFKHSGPPTCLECRKNEAVSFALSKGMTPVDVNSLDAGGGGEYRFSNCEHSIRLSRNNLMTKARWHCPRCKDMEVIEKADKLGVKFHHFVDSDYRKFVGSFKSCGCVKEFPKADMFRPNRHFAKCLVCMQSKHEQEALSAGIKLLGKAENNDPNYRSFQMSCCGKTQDIEVTHVRGKNFNCRHCNTDRYSKESNLYLYKFTHDNFSWLKLGIAINVEGRANQYGLPEGTLSELLHTISFDNGHDALLFEKNLHVIFKPQRLNKTTMKRYHTKSGCTECYPTSAEEVILNAMKGYNYGE